MSNSNEKFALIEYRVRIIPPDLSELPNEMMDEALRTVEATIGYSLQKMIHKRYIAGVDSLGTQGFTVEVIPVDE